MSLLSRLAVTAARAYGALSSNPNAVSASYLVVAGGGGGGSNAFESGGGGGAGGLLTSTATLSILNTYSITVGAGGAGGVSGSNSIVSGTGLTTITTTGGGRGGAGGGAGYAASTGGSGGGGSYNYSFSTGAAGNTPSTTPAQGFAGGNGVTSSTRGGGGGGGSSSVGANATNSPAAGGNGGSGTASSISGSSVTYAGGGGGGEEGGTRGTGTGGGGNGGNSSNNCTSGTANTGGGGGGIGGNQPSSSTFGAGGSGVVIISYTSATPRFVGGTLTTSGGNQIHTFTSSGTLSPLTPVTASYLVVAGGGGCNNDSSGGGGAGGLLTSSTTLYSGATYIVTVGAGGAYTTNGSDSILSGTGLTTITATGGGRAGGAVTSITGGNGGSGGGGGGGGTPNTGGTGVSGQGFAGGSGNATGNYTGGGGGGSSAVGSAGGTAGGNGGAGTASSISGSSVTYAGGGGGNGGLGSPGTGGAGGGGNGGSTTNQAAATSGTANTGGGAGGGNSANQRTGGSGIVIISYAGSQVFNGGLVTSSGGNTIHTFNATGALTPLTNNLNNSLRFRGSASAYLSRTLTTPTNNKIWTLSLWVKRSTLTTTQVLLGTASEELRYISDGGASGVVDSFQYNYGAGYGFRTNATYRDVSAWYHLVIATDTTQAIAANRVKFYVNGVQATTDGTYDISQNANTQINSAVAHNIARRTAGSLYFDGYMTDINFIDGQALEPYYFGNNDANQVWKPILYKGTYGTNGFYLPFSDTSALTTSSNVGLGKDFSNNGNYWATNNISITAGVTYDAMLDVPTNTSATVANYCVNNPIDTSPTGGVNAITISGANLNLAGASTDWAACRATIGVTSGKWYWECTRTGANNLIFGIGLNSTTLVNAYSSTSYGYFSTGDKYSNNVSSAYGASFTSGDVIGVAFDADAGTLTFYKNNTSQGTAYTGLTSGPYFPLNQVYTTGSTASINFGQRPFTYTAPSGFVALNTFNLPTPTILQGNKYMDAVTYNGSDGSQKIVMPAQFYPDLVWAKSRNNITNNILMDSVRGGNLYLSSNTTTGDTTSTGLATFSSNGITWTGGASGVNASTYTYVDWAWNAGSGSTSSNTSGTITSTVSASTTAGFSIVTYTGTGANATVGHGLGVAPKWVIVKARSVAGENWQVYSSSLTSAAYRIRLNATDAQDSQPTMWNSTAPTSTVFSVGTASGVNTSAVTYVAYCWAEIAGFSKFGSYTGNGSADGPFVFTGFRPSYILLKRTDAANVWLIGDSKRDGYNSANPSANKQLQAQATNAESNFDIDYLSNGFKLRNTDSYLNASGGTYIYMAFAENPFKNANAR